MVLGSQGFPLQRVGGWPTRQVKDDSAPGGPSGLGNECVLLAAGEAQEEREEGVTPPPTALIEAHDDI